jgi:tripartite-type tricarboxylate transporter receptor subunit TctC
MKTSHLKPRLMMGMLVIGCTPVAGIAQQSATDYPSRPIRFIVPYPPGGITDILARALGQKLTARWGQQVVIDNRAGASGNIGTGIAARAPADGYTLLFGNSSTHGVNPALFSSVPYDAVRDFAPITLVAHVSNVLLVSASMTVQSVKELIAMAKAKPGALTFASNSVGSSNHLAGELLKTMAGIDIVHVPYKGAVAASIDLIAGRVSMMFDNITTAVPNIKAGKLRGLATTGAKRSDVLPELPTMSESGLPGFEVTGWWGVFVPASTPKPIISKLNAGIADSLKLPDMREYLKAQGADPEGDTPEHFAIYVQSELRKWAKVVKDSGAKVD